MFKNLPILYKLLLTFGAVLAACSVSSTMLIGRLVSVAGILAEAQDGPSLLDRRELLVSGVHAAIGLTVSSLATGAVGIVLASFFLRLLVVRPIEAARDAAIRIARRDLTADIRPDSRDENGALLTALDSMQGSLRSSLREVHEASDSIATAASQVSSGANDLSARTESTAASLQQSAATMKSLTEAVDANGRSADEARALASSTSTAVARGSEAVGRVVTSMSDIQGTSKQVSDIISVIDGIAFQTNILALNAAVEAARAGEQGRGFAVVASEVRSLSQRSSAAAREIRTLITGSVAKVELGAKQVTEAGLSMTGIMDSVTRLTRLVDAIASSSRTQGHDIDLVGRAVQDVDSMTQQNAALVEQSAAAAESLRDQAECLSRVVGAFRVRADRIGA